MPTMLEEINQRNAEIDATIGLRSFMLSRAARYSVHQKEEDFEAVVQIAMVPTDRQFVADNGGSLGDLLDSKDYNASYDAIGVLARIDLIVGGDFPWQS